MNVFDAGALHFVNRGAQQSAAFDHFVQWVSLQPIVKGCVAAAVLVALWCGSPAAQVTQRRAVLITTLIAALAAEMLARVLALILPFRLRPLHNPDIGFILPSGMNPAFLEGWSAFPSDHAVLFFAVATGVWHASRHAGAWLLVFAALVISLPRFYLGLHHLTDILGGALLGVLVAMAFQQTAIRDRLAQPFLAWQERWPYSFYAFGWYFLFELAHMFKDLRWMLKALLQAGRT